MLQYTTYSVQCTRVSCIILLYELVVKIRGSYNILHIAEQLSDLLVESLSDTAERETRIQLAALNNYPGRRKKN